MLMSMLHANTNSLSLPLAMTILSLSAIYRTLSDSSILMFLMNTSIALIVSLSLMKKIPSIELETIYVSVQAAILTSINPVAYVTIFTIYFITKKAKYRYLYTFLTIFCATIFLQLIK